MEQKRHHLTNFVQKENFELGLYITHLFEHYKTQIMNEEKRFGKRYLLIKQKQYS